MQARKTIRLSELVALLGGELQGQDVPIQGVASLEQGDASSITFLSNPKLKSQLSDTTSGAVIVRPADAKDLGIPCIVCKDPYLYFCKVAQLFHPLPQARAGIHPSAVVAEDAQIDPSAEVGPLAVIESGVKIGARSIISAACTVGANTNIGADCLLYHRVAIYHDCVLGNQVIIHSGAVIGADGFGNAWAGDHWEKIPQIGRVVIGDNVEIGANTTIDRGAMGDTLIAQGARIDNQIQLGHNVEVGAFTAIAGCAGIAGSTKIGAGCLIGGGASIGGHLKITDRVTILGASDVATDIDEPGVYGGPTPAIPYAAWRRNAVHYRHFDQLVKRIKILEKNQGSSVESAEDTGS